MVEGFPSWSVKLHPFPWWHEAWREGERKICQCNRNSPGVSVLILRTIQLVWVHVVMVLFKCEAPSPEKITCVSRAVGWCPRSDSWRASWVCDMTSGRCNVDEHHLDDFTEFDRVSAHRGIQSIFLGCCHMIRLQSARVGSHKER